MNLSEQLGQALASDARYQQALSVVHANADGGKVWLIGGTVYRTLAHLMYDRQLRLPGMEATHPTHDFDFILERLQTINPGYPSPFSVPREWNEGAHTPDFGSFGSPRLFRGDVSVDLIPLEDADRVNRLLACRKPLSLAQHLENYFTCVPLTIQAMAFDIETGELHGTVGLRALADRTVAVQNLREYVNYCELRGITIEEYIREKAESLGFTALELPPFPPLLWNHVLEIRMRQLANLRR